MWHLQHFKNPNAKAPVSSWEMQSKDRARCNLSFAFGDSCTLSRPALGLQNNPLLSSTADHNNKRAEFQWPGLSSEKVDVPRWQLSAGSAMQELDGQEQEGQGGMANLQFNFLEPPVPYTVL